MRGELIPPAALEGFPAAGLLAGAALWTQRWAPASIGAESSRSREPGEICGEEA